MQPNVFDFGLVTLLLAASLVGGPRSIWAAPVGMFHPRRRARQHGRLRASTRCSPTGCSSSSPASDSPVGSQVWQRRGSASAEAPLRSDCGRRGCRQSIPLRRAAPTSSSVLGARSCARSASRRPSAVYRRSTASTSAAEPGQITAIIGANGAGKTTLLNAISGLDLPRRGRCAARRPFDRRAPAEQVARAGVSRTFQTPQVPESLSVLDVAMTGTLGRERVSAASVAFRTGSYWRWRRSAIARARVCARLRRPRGDADDARQRVAARPAADPRGRALPHRPPVGGDAG